jgi:GntR family transcriptional regulator, rspAB operon transcriptional repressor
MSTRTAMGNSEKSLLKDVAYESIKAQIQNSTFAAGHFLSERQLSSLLGMSKTPVKAAIERLEQEGFVNVSPQQGIVVRELSVKEVADQFEMRTALEVFVVRAIAGNLTAKQQSLFEKNLAFQTAAVSKENVGRLVELDADFHWLMCEVFGNQAIVDCMRLQRAKIHRVIFQVMSGSPGRLKDAVSEHTAIYSAIKRGKVDQAAKLVEQHLEFGKQYLLASKWDRKDRCE